MTPISRAFGGRRRDGVETRARPTACAAPLLLEERQLGPRVALTPRDEPGFRHRASAVKDHHD